ncbi:hypothetical protein D3C74_453610 [compost metagenome]
MQVVKCPQADSGGTDKALLVETDRVVLVVARVEIPVAACSVLVKRGLCGCSNLPYQAKPAGYFRS